MNPIVCKFGGTSVRGVERMRAAARLIAEAARQQPVVAVLSAQGDVTDRLLAMAEAQSPDFPRRELDQLLSAGEQISVALCAAALRDLGAEAVSLTGWQAGILTDGRHGDAQVLALSSDRIRRELDRGRIVLAAGFQGVDAAGDVTTLGRGGSDTTAVALACLLKAPRCEIFTDVCGVYDRDPRQYPEAVKYDRISYGEMLRLIRGGAQVLHERSVLLARRHRLPIVVRSAFCGEPGTVVG